MSHLYSLLDIPPDQLVDRLLTEVNCVSTKEQPFLREYWEKHYSLDAHSTLSDLLLVFKRVEFRSFRENSFPDNLCRYPDSLLLALTSSPEHASILAATPGQLLRVFVHLYWYFRLEPLRRLVALNLIPNKASFIEEIIAPPLVTEQIDFLREWFTCSLSDFPGVFSYLTAFHKCPAEIRSFIQLTAQEKSVVSEWIASRAKLLGDEDITLLTDITRKHLITPGTLITVRYFDENVNFIGQITLPVMQSGGRSLTCQHRIHLTLATVSSKNRQWSNILGVPFVNYTPVYNKKVKETSKLVAARVFIVPKPASLKILATLAVRKKYTKTELAETGLCDDLLEEVYPVFMTWIK